ncbi:hypothetical protein NEUTE1DRAFT_51023, partial [Neurospora tetrasperma FGSC 2508]
SRGRLLSRSLALANPDKQNPPGIPLVPCLAGPINSTGKGSMVFSLRRMASR